MNLRYYYSDSIADFCGKSTDEIYGRISKNSTFDVTDGQRLAWLEEIDLLKNILIPYKGDIFFEYSIPRLGKRIDVVLLINGIVYCLEFKVGEEEYTRADVEQVWDYALDLSYFHEDSHNLIVIPILIATSAIGCSSKFEFSKYNQKVMEPVLSNREFLEKVLQQLTSQYCLNVNLPNWGDSRYSPTPTIIQAASALYLDHSVEDITRTEASGKALSDTTNCVLNILNATKENNEKAICFVTGVPGAGKTLIGLNVAIEQFKNNESKSTDEDRDLAVYLSGNGPLVQVLTEALARDKKRREEQLHPGQKYSITNARNAVKSFIQSIHTYRDFALEVIKRPITGDTLQIDPLKSHKSKNWIVEHVAIFDEAQRCWDQQHLAAWLKRKKGIDNFPMSEAEFLIWSLNLRDDWSLIVCLVGGGQEINTGEAGIAEWINAVKCRFPEWNIYISSKIKEKEYAEGDIDRILQDCQNFQVYDTLHLAVSQRSFRAESLSNFVHALLDCQVDDAKKYLLDIKDRYPILLTRSLEKAKETIREMAQGSERYGMLVSSQAYRLKPLAIDVRCKPDTIHWFLDDINDIRSSLFLEDAATEFDVQGLELDYTCVVWDGDMRYKDGGWNHFSFVSQWNRIVKEERKLYQKNAYRVLLTRARQGMIICVPEGTIKDKTRLPEFYNETYNYLKSIGIEELK